MSNHVGRNPSTKTIDEMTEFTEQNEVSQRIIHDQADNSLLQSDANLPNVTELRALIQSAQSGSRMLPSSSALRVGKRRTDDSESDTVFGRNNVSKMHETDKSIKVKLD